MRRLPVLILAMGMLCLVSPAIAQAASHDAPLNSARADAGKTLEAARIEAWHAYFAELRSELLASDQPRRFALGAMSVNTTDADGNPLPESQKDPLMVRAAARATDDALVQWIVANWQVTIRDSKDAAATVATLTRIEPDNAAAWTLALNFASNRGDDAGVDAALERMAASTRSDEHIIDLLRAWMAVYDAHPPPAMLFDDPADIDSAPFVQAMSYAAAFALPGYSSLMKICKPADPVDPVRMQRCGAAGRLMADHSTSLAGRSIGWAVLRKLDGSAPGANDASIRNSDWISFQLPKASGFELKDPLAMQAYIADWRHVDDELEIAKRALRRAGIAEEPPPGWRERLATITVP